VLSDRGVLSVASEEVFAYYVTAIFLQFLCLLHTYRNNSESTSIDCEDEGRART